MLQIIKKLIPESLKPYLIGLFYGWHGNYKSWEEAGKKCQGYDSGKILETVRASALKVKNGMAVYERDSVIFDEIQYAFPLLSGLMWIAAMNNGRLNVLDFGGGLGTTYFQNKVFLDPLKEVNWCVVEQAGFVEAGHKDFSGERLHFFRSIEDCTKKFEMDLVLLSGVIQYIKEPYILLDQVKSTGIRHIIIDRTPFIKGKDRLTIQKVPSKIYKGSYPCWFFNKTNFLEKFTGDYKLILEFEALDRANIPSEFKGFIFQRIEALNTY